MPSRVMRVQVNAPVVAIQHTPWYSVSGAIGPSGSQGSPSVLGLHAVVIASSIDDTGSAGRTPPSSEFPEAQAATTIPLIATAQDALKTRISAPVLPPLAEGQKRGGS